MSWEWTFAENARRLGMTRIEDELDRLCRAWRQREEVLGHKPLPDETVREMMRVARQAMAAETRPKPRR